MATIISNLGIDSTFAFAILPSPSSLYDDAASSSSSSSSIGPLAPDLDDALNDGAIAERVRQGRFRE